MTAGWAFLDKAGPFRLPFLRLSRERRNIRTGALLIARLVLRLEKQLDCNLPV